MRENFVSNFGILGGGGGGGSKTAGCFVGTLPAIFWRGGNCWLFWVKLPRTAQAKDLILRGKYLVLHVQWKFLVR